MKSLQTTFRIDCRNGFPLLLRATGGLGMHLWFSVIYLGFIATNLVAVTWIEWKSDSSRRGSLHIPKLVACGVAVFSGPAFTMLVVSDLWKYWRSKYRYRSWRLKYPVYWKIMEEKRRALGISERAFVEYLRKAMAERAKKGADC